MRKAAVRLRVSLILAAVLAGATSLASAQTPREGSEDRACARERVVGGEPTCRALWPGYAALRRVSADGTRVEYFCGGVAIADRWILTAAHCVAPFLASPTAAITSFDEVERPYRLEVVLGAVDLLAPDRDAEAIRVTRVIAHEDYVAAMGADVERGVRTLMVGTGADIALIELETPWPGEKAALSLASETDPGVGESLWVAGFGSTLARPTSPARISPVGRSPETYAAAQRLLEAHVPEIAASDCALSYRSAYPGAALRIDATTLCAGPPRETLERFGGPERDSCEGDSGGPLARWTAEGPVIVGLVSWGAPTCAGGLAGVYTRISAYADWIRQTVQPTATTLIPGAVGDLTPDFVQAFATQIGALLGREARYNLELEITAGRRVQVGALTRFLFRAGVDGKPLLFDVDAQARLSTLLPSSEIPARAIKSVRRGEVVALPGVHYPQIEAFEAAPPIGRSYLIGVIAPEDAPIEVYRALDGLKTKSATRGAGDVSPVQALTRLVHAIRAAVKGGRAGDAARWGVAIVPYDVVE